MIKFLRELFGGNSKDYSYLERDIDTLKGNIKDSFSRLKDDMGKQSKWIDHLYNTNQDLGKLHDTLKAHHDNHEKIHSKDVETINKDIGHINSWISHLHENQSKQEEDMRKLESSVRGAFNTYNKYLLDIYKIVHTLKEEQSKNHSHATQVSNGAVETLIDVDRRQSEDKSVVPIKFTNAEPEPMMEAEEEDSMIDEIAPGMVTTAEKGPLSNLSENLTRSQKMILAHMMNTEQKLSYKDLSMLMNVSVSTIKNHICNMRNKGFPLQEYNDEGNVKRYYLAENMKQIMLSKRL
jgi:hypothetical protein